MHIDIPLKPSAWSMTKLRSGHFRSVDELITAGIQAWREKNARSLSKARPERNLVEVCAMVRGLADDLDITRNRSGARPIDLG